MSVSKRLQGAGAPYYCYCYLFLIGGCFGRFVGGVVLFARSFQMVR